MTDQSEVLGTTPATQTQDTPEPKASNLESLLTGALEQVKRPDGTQKYSTPEDFVKSAVQAQSFIPQLQQEKQQMTESLVEAQQRLAALEAEKVQLESKLTEVLSVTSKPTSEPAPAPAQATPTVDVESLTAQIKAQLAQEEAQKAAQGNQQAVLEHIQTTFGDQAQTVTAQAVKELFGGNAAALSDLASKSPQAVKTLLAQYNTAPATLPQNGTLGGAQKPTSTKPTSPLHSDPTESAADFRARMAKLLVETNKVI